MQVSPTILPPRLRRGGRGAKTACTECRIRKQKCDRRQGAPCSNCRRRYPPVACVFKSCTLYSNFGGASFQVSQVDANDVGMKSHTSSFGLQSQCQRRSFTPFTSSHESSFNVEPHPPTIPLPSPDRSSPERMTSQVNFKEINKLTPKDEEEIQLLVPRAITRFQHQSPTLARQMPLGAVSFGGVILPDAGLRGSSAERNAELVHFFHHFVVPNRCSVDGSDVPTFFTTKILPMIMPSVAILMASSAQLAEPGFQISKPYETYALKANVLSTINNLLQQDSKVVSRQALPAVLHTVIIEWYWGNTASLWAHLKGAREIIKHQGGFKGVNYPILQQGIIIVDWEIACCFERDLFFQDSKVADEDEILIPPAYPEALRSPLLAYPIPFRHNEKKFHLSSDSAEILDIVRSLTISMAPPISHSASSETKRIATSLQNLTEIVLPLNLTSETAPSSIIHSIIMLTAQLYSRSITTLTPLSQQWTSSLLGRFYAEVSAVSLQTWKQIPGIFLWILLVACPGAGDDLMGKWIKRKMAVSGMMIALEGYGVAISALRAFWRVQRWIEKEGSASSN